MNNNTKQSCMKIDSEVQKIVNAHEDTLSNLKKAVDDLQKTNTSAMKTITAEGMKIRLARAQARLNWETGTGRSMVNDLIEIGEKMKSDLILAEEMETARKAEIAHLKDEIASCVIGYNFSNDTATKNGYVDTVERNNERLKELGATIEHVSLARVEEDKTVHDVSDNKIAEKNNSNLTIDDFIEVDDAQIKKKIHVKEGFAKVSLIKKGKNRDLAITVTVGLENAESYFGKYITLRQSKDGMSVALVVSESVVSSTGFYVKITATGGRGECQKKTFKGQFTPRFVPFIHEFVSNNQYKIKYLPDGTMYITKGEF